MFKLSVFAGLLVAGLMIFALSSGDKGHKASTEGASDRFSNTDGDAGESEGLVGHVHASSFGFETLLNVGGYSYLSVGAMQTNSVGFEWLEHIPEDPNDPIWQWLDDVAIGGAETTPGTFRMTEVYSTSFYPKMAVARDSMSVVLAGPSVENGKVVSQSLTIERWDFEYFDGSPYLERARATSSIGVPVAYQVPTLGTIGGTFANWENVKPPVESRSMVYSGSLLWDTNGIAIDPEGRFILCATKGGKLYQLNLSGVPTPQLLFNSSQLAGLGGDAHSLKPIEHQTHGRIYVLQSYVPFEIGGFPTGAALAGDAARTVLVDGDNDGVFEQTVELPDYGWLSSSYADKSLWVDAFEWIDF